MKRITLSTAQIYAAHLQDLLVPGYTRMAIVGSMRRTAPLVKDIEFLVQPRVGAPAGSLLPDLLDPVSALDERLATLEKSKIIAGEKNGPRYKRFRLLRMHNNEIAAPPAVDLFLCIDHADWGVLYALRTGPAEYSRWLVTPQASGGALPAGYQVRDRRLWRDGVQLQTPEEKDFFDAIDLAMPTPSQRKPFLIKALP